MGVVYKARQISLNRVVAVKMILAGELASLDTVLRFHAEAESAANLRHPNIVAIHETGEIDGRHYFAMEHIEGRDLAHMVRDGPLTPNRAARYLEKVAEAVEYAHQHNVLHRDLKPSNVLVGERDEPRVTDFGLAKKLTVDSALTLSGQLLGSPNFMPPEQASSTQGKVGPQSDVYGLGALLYHVVTGRPPFHAATLEETLHQVFEQEPVSARALNPGVPRDLDTICLKCLEKDPQRRYPTAQAVAEELGRFLRSEPILARPVNAIGKAWRWCRRKPVLAGLGAAIVLLLLLLAIGGPIAAEHYRQLSYASDLTAAWQSWEIGNITHSIELLKRHRPWPGQSDLREFAWRYLWNLCLPASETPPKEDPGFTVLFSAVSRDGSRFATSGVYGNVTIWNVKTSQVERQLTTGDFFAGTVAFSPDGRHLVTTGGHYRCGSSGTLKVWDVATGNKVLEKTKLRGLSGEFSPDGRWFAIIVERDIFVLDVNQNWEVVRHWPAHNDRIWEVKWSPDGTRLVSVGEGQEAHIWDAASGEELGPLEGHSLGVRRAAFSSDGQMVATAGEDKTVRIWDTATGVELKEDSYTHAVDLWALAWSPDGHWVASAGSDGLVKLRNRKTQSNWTLRGHSRSVKTLGFGLSSNVLITASLDSTIRFWDLAELPPTDDALLGRAGSGDTFYSPIAFSRDNRFIVTVDPNATDILLWNVTAGTLQSRFRIPTSDVRVLLSPDEEATVARIEVDDLTFVSDNRLAVACGIQLHPPESNTWRYRITLYDLQCNALVNGFPGRAPIILSPDGEHLATQGKARGSVQIRHLATGRRWPDPNVVRPLASRFLGALAFSPDGNTLAASVLEPEGYKLLLLEAATGKLLAPLESGSSQLPITPINAITFTPDGDRLITVGWRPQVQVWDVHRRTFAFELSGHTAHVHGLAISPKTGKTLATGSENGVLKFWSLEQRKELLTLHAHEGSVCELSFAPDGNTLASGGKEGKVRLWRAVPEL